VRPGPDNLLTDVAGLAVGNAEDRVRLTGVTVVLSEARATAAVDVRGGAPGTRETALLSPNCLVGEVDAIVLSGGSAYGLAAADEAMLWLAERGRGFAIAGTVVPIVPAAIIFDLGRGQVGGPHPHRGLARQAAERAGRRFALGNAGAGTGAKAGRYKGGLGSASLRNGSWTVGALAVANPVGSPVMPGSGCLWAWWLEQNGELGGQRPPPPAPPGGHALDLPHEGRLGGHTTLAVVATDARLGKAECERLAIMAQDGIARAVRPSHTPFDGDTVFALATGGAAQPDALGLATLGQMAADCLARAIARGVFEAETAAGMPAYRDRHAEAFGAQRR